MLKETQTGLSRAWSRAEGALLPNAHEFRKLVNGAADPGQGFNLAALLIGRHLATPSRVSPLGYQLIGLWLCINHMRMPNK